jgi:hypothetical protein
MDAGLPDLQPDPSAQVVDFKLAPFATPVASDVNEGLLEFYGNQCDILREAACVPRNRAMYVNE